MTYLTVFAALICAHFVADYAMQNAYIATTKAEKTAEGNMAMLAHGVHHGAAAWVVLLLVGATPDVIGTSIVFVTVSHIVFDAWKARDHWTGIYVDQALHIGIMALVAWAVVIS